jgi:GSH-dependent disulfide-bond oxidoreductase
MIDLYYAPTPNGWKISIMLEELGIPYRVVPINIRAGDQFRPEFLAISPNNRIPAIVDHAPVDGGGPFSVFETGAILIYLADKTGRFIPHDMRARSVVIQWLMWQMSALGPMLGQHGHFALYAPEKIPYAIERYRDEAARLYHVLDTQLGKTGAYVAGRDYSIADIACFPWTMTHKAQGFTLDDYPNVKRWYAELRARPKCRRGLRSASSSTSRSTRKRGKTCSASARRSWRGRSECDVPDALQREAMRCRAGTQPKGWVPHLRCAPRAGHERASVAFN